FVNSPQNLQRQVRSQVRSYAAWLLLIAAAAAYYPRALYQTLRRHGDLSPGLLPVAWSDATGLRSGFHLSAVLRSRHVAIRADAAVAARFRLVRGDARRHDRCIQTVRIHRLQIARPAA